MNSKPAGKIAAALACALLQAACSTERQVVPTTFTDSAGVTIVSNDYLSPVWAPEARWTLAYQPDLQVGNIPGAPGHQLFHVSYSRRLANGGIVVANAGFGDVRVYDDMGGYLWTAGLGIHAADSARPLLVFEPGPDELLVYQGDRSLARFHDTDPRPSRTTLEDPGEGFEEPQPIGVFSDGTMLFRVRFPWDDTKTGIGRRRARLLHYAQDGKLIGTIADVDDDAVLFAEHGVYVFAPTASAAAGDSTVWYGDGEHYELRELARDGRLLRIVRLNRPPSPVLWVDSTLYRRAVTQKVQGTERDSSMRVTLDSSVFPDSFPVFDRILVDDVGDLWVRNYQWVDLGTGKSWTVFDPQGRFLGEVTTPTILEIHEIGDNFVLGRMADPVGREAVYTFDLLKPGTAPPPRAAQPAPADSAAPPPDSAGQPPPG